MTIGELKLMLAQYDDGTEVKCVGWCSPKTKRPDPQTPMIVVADNVFYVCAESSYCEDDFVINENELEGYNEPVAAIAEPILSNPVPDRVKPAGTAIPSLSSILQKA